MKRGHGVAANAAWSVLGQGLQLAALAVGIPMLVRGLGHERYAVLNLSILIAGYATLLDLGMARAAVRFMSSSLGEGRSDEAKGIFRGALLPLLGLAMVSSGLLMILGPDVTDLVLSGRGEVLAEARESVRWAGLMVPTAMLAQLMAGALEAGGRFGLVQLLRTPSNLLNIVLPLIGIAAGWTIPGMVVALGIKNLVFFGIAAALAAGALDWLRRWGAPFPATVLMRTGLGLAVLNAFALMSGSLERVVIGAMLPVQEVTQYGVPQQVVNALGTVVLSVMPVLFASFARLEASDPAQMALLHRAAMSCIVPGAALLGGMLAVCGPELLELWVGRGFTTGGLVLQIQCVWLVCVAAQSITLTLLQATSGVGWAVGSCALTLVLQLGGTAGLVQAFGLPGAAAAGVIAHGAGLTVALIGAHQLGLLRTEPGLPRSTVVAVVTLALVSVGAIWIKASVQPSPVALLASTAGAGVMAAFVIWRAVLDSDTRDAIRSGVLKGAV